MTVGPSHVTRGYGTGPAPRYTRRLMNATLSPYLNFNGNAADAMRFYHSILGGALTIQTFAEEGMAQNENEKNLTLHAALTGDGITLFASDGRPDQQVIFGDNVHLSLQGDD